MICHTILGIETSCDDTCASVVQGGHTILSNVVCSQNQAHSRLGGVIPEIAARQHVEKISDVVNMALEKAGVTKDKLDGIAVTNRPGLSSSLMVGVSFASAFGFALRLPLAGIHHIEAHLYASILENPEIPMPHIGLAVSGGHTMLVLIKDDFVYEVVGQTTDDAAGEAFDKAARYLGLGFPGGPLIDRLAKQNTSKPVMFTSPFLHTKDFDFSFSGIKTAVQHYAKSLGEEEKQKQLPAIADGFQQAVVKVLVEKTCKAARHYGMKAISINGGVAANSLLRSQMKESAEKYGIQVFAPSLPLCTDNAAMIAGLAYHRFRKGQQDGYDLDVQSNMSSKTNSEKI